jgi:hypothetical protein
MEDYIYILAGVAYLAYSIYSASQKQKKKQQQAAQMPYAEAEDSGPVVKRESTPSTFNEILGVQNFEFNVEEDPYGETEIEEEILDVVPEEEGMRTTQVQGKYEEKENLEEMAVHWEEEEESDFEFSLRDAVISSEILNPPYIDR